MMWKQNIYLLPLDVDHSLSSERSLISTSRGFSWRNSPFVLGYIDACFSNQILTGSQWKCLTGYIKFTSLCHTLHWETRHAESLSARARQASLSFSVFLYSSIGLLAGKQNTILAWKNESIETASGHLGASPRDPPARLWSRPCSPDCTSKHGTKTHPVTTRYWVFTRISKVVSKIVVNHKLHLQQAIKSRRGSSRKKNYVRQQEISLAKARCAALLSNKSCEETDENVGLWYLAQRHVFSFFSNKLSSCPLIYVVGKRHLCLLRARRIMFNAISTSPQKNLTYFHRTPMIKMMNNRISWTIDVMHDNSCFASTRWCRSY